LTFFVTFCLEAVLVWISAALILRSLPLGLSGIFGYFGSSYKASKPGTPGSNGRGNVIVFFTSITLIALTIAAAVYVNNVWG
jgi:hypothetical protein